MYQFLRSASIFATFVFTSCCTAAEPTIEVAGVQVVRQQFGEGFQGLRPFNAQSVGTSLALFVRSPDASIIKLDLEASKIEAFVDDTKQSLLSVDPQELGGFNSQEGFGDFPKVTEDGKAGMIAVSGTGLPAKTATKIGVKGILVVQLGGESKATKSDPIELVRGTKLSVAGVDFSVAKVGKPGYGEEPVEVTFKSTDKAFSVLRGVKFYDANGKEIPSKSGGSSSMGFAGNYTYGVSYRLGKKLDGKVQVELDKWTDLKEVEIPIRVSAGVGG